MPVIGFLSTTSAVPFAHLVSGFRRGLQEIGYVEGRNVAIEFRWAEGQYDRVPALAADLVRRQIAVIVTTGGETSAVAAKAATTTIPIVFNTGTDPVRLGLVASLARPGGNATGVNIFTTELAEKRLGLLHDLVPAASSIVVLVNPHFAPAVANAREAEAAARAGGKGVVIFNAATESEIETAFGRMMQERSSALLVGSDPFFNSRREQIVALAARHRIPAIYEWREFVQAGGLISYGTNLVEAYRQQGIYAGRIISVWSVLKLVSESRDRIGMMQIETGWGALLPPTRRISPFWSSTKHGGNPPDWTGLPQCVLLRVTPPWPQGRGRPWSLGRCRGLSRISARRRP